MRIRAAGNLLRLCSNGPCRIMEDRPRGVCGADADTIVCRNFLRAVAAGSGCYIHVLENSIKNLKKAAVSKEKLGSTERFGGWRVYLNFHIVVIRMRPPFR